MEFKYTKREPAAGREQELQRKLLAWPDSYYREREPRLRLELLDAADEQGLTPEDNRVRRELYEIRYPRTGKVKDTYLKAWIDTRFLSDRKGGGLFKSRSERKLREALDPTGIRAHPEDPRYRRLLYNELYHLGMLYAALCCEDKNFNSVIFGIGQLSEEKVARKTAGEFLDVAVNIPRAYGAGEEYADWTRALKEAYRDMFPDYAYLMDEEEA